MHKTCSRFALFVRNCEAIAPGLISVLRQHRPSVGKKNTSCEKGGGLFRPSQVEGSYFQLLFHSCFSFPEEIIIIIKSLASPPSRAR